MSNQSMTDAAFKVLESYSKPIPFSELWNKVSKSLGMNDDLAKKKISVFYTNLSLDGRFVVLKENKWQLRQRLKFADSYVDTSAIEIDDNDEEEMEDSEELDVPSSNQDEY